MSDSPPSEFPVPGHQLPPAGSAHSASGGTNDQSLITNHRGSHQSPDDDEISLLDILIVLAKHKKLILGLPFIVAVVTAGITLLMPNWYTATAKLLPPQQSQLNA